MLPLTKFIFDILKILIVQASTREKAKELRPSMRSSITSFVLSTSHLYFFYLCVFSTTSSIYKLLELLLIDYVDEFENLGKHKWYKVLYEHMDPQMKVISVILSLSSKIEGHKANQNLMLKGFAQLLIISCYI